MNKPNRGMLAVPDFDAFLVSKICFIRHARYRPYRIEGETAPPWVSQITTSEDDKSDKIPESRLIVGPWPCCKHHNTNEQTLLRSFSLDVWSFIKYCHRQMWLLPLAYWTVFPDFVREKLNLVYIKFCRGKADTAKIEETKEASVRGQGWPNSEITCGGMIIGIVMIVVYFLAWMKLSQMLEN